MSTSALLAMVKGAQKKYSRNNSKAVKFKEGKTRVRILQGDVTKPFWKDLGVHWIKTEKNGKAVAVVGCMDIVHEQPCPICTAIDKATRAAEDDDTLAIIKEWKARKAVLLNALIRSGNDASEEPQVLEMTPTTFSTICSMIEEYMADYGNVLDPKTGIDFVIERKGKGLDTEYTVMPALKAKPVPEGTLDKLIDLDEFVEKEYFRGDETKALNAISNMMGIDVGQRAIANKAAGGAAAGLLTTSAAAVEDAVVEDDLEVEEVAPARPAKAAKAEPAKAAPAADDFGAEIDTDDLDSVLDDLDNI